MLLTKQQLLAAVMASDDETRWSISHIKVDPKLLGATVTATNGHMAVMVTSRDLPQGGEIPEAPRQHGTEPEAPIYLHAAPALEGAKVLPKKSDMPPTLSDGVTCASFAWQTGGSAPRDALIRDATQALGANQTLAVLISSAAVSPARTSASPASAPGSGASAPASSGKSSASRKTSGRRGGSSRMFQGSLAPTVGGTWGSSSKDYGNAGLLSATGFWTAAISESPNVAVACSLSAVLMRRALPKYSLSPKAAAGILRRAAKRGRALPPALQQALTALASTIPVAAPRTT